MAAGKEVSVRLKVEADNLDAVKQKLKDLGAEVTHVGGLRTDGLQRQLQALESRLDPAARAAQGLAKDSDTLGKALQAGIISQARHNELLAASAQRHGAAAKSTKLAAHEMTNLTYQIQDAAVQLAGGQNPFLILMQQGPQATGAVGGVGRALSLLATPTVAAGLSVAALGVGFGVVVAKAMALQDEVRGFNVVLKATGNEARTTATAMQGAVTQMTRLGTSRADAVAMATTYLRNGQLKGAGTAADLGTLATDMGAGLGISTTDAFGKLTAGLTGGIPGLRQLATETKALSVAQYEAARAALEHGDKAKALQIVVDALKDRFGGLHKESLSPAQKAMEDFSNAYDRLVTKAANSPLTISVVVKTSGLMDELGTFFETGGGPMRDRLIRNVIPGLEMGQLIAQEFGGTVAYTPRLNNNPRRPGEGALTGAVYPDASGAAPGAPIPGRKPTTQTGMTLDQAFRVSDAAKANDNFATAMVKVGAARTIFLAGQAAFDAEMERGGTDASATALRLQAERKARLELSGSIAEQTAQLTINTQEALKAADAYLQSSAAGERAKAMQQARIDSLTSGIDVETRYRQILAERAAAQAASGAQEVATTQVSAAARQRLADASLLGVEAQQKAELAEKVRQATIGETIALENAQGATADALRRIIEAKTAAVVADDAAQRKARLGGILQGQGEQLATLGKERELLFATAEQRAVGLARLQMELQLRREGADLSSTEAQRALANAEAIAKAGVEMDRLNQISQVFDNAFDRVGDAITQAFVQGGGAAVNFRSVVSGVLASIASDLLKLAVINPMKNAVLGGLTGLFAGGSSFGAYTTSSTVVGGAGRIVGGLHDGGVVGAGWTFQRSVDPSVFSGAPRYHTGGIAGDEVPAILQRGEEVLTADDPRHRFNLGAANTNGPVSINMPITVNASGGTQEQNADLADQIGRAVGDQLDARIVTVLRQQMRPMGLLNGGSR
ncbi:phage tail length tape measure family protein [Azospirillum canadense]|uniref:phage tail length tape measure family protein n=1 Tax=Azospirillum canadense TaxID=403962 RepID=UPI002225F352|nr:phage tail length tape measure family protein [Azospirillum canadense]MCW2242808.1 phage-related minor tail protein [Azospirillum canadense]